MRCPLFGGKALLRHSPNLLALSLRTFDLDQDLQVRSSQGRIHPLEKLYLAGRQSRPEWPALEALHEQCEREDAAKV